MALFGSFGKIFTRVVAGVATGGASELLRLAGGTSVARVLESGFSPGLFKPATPLEALAQIPGSIVLTAAAGKLPAGTTIIPQAAGLPPIIRGPTTGGTISPAPVQAEDPMGLNIGALLGGLGGVLSGAPVDPRLRTLGSVAQVVGGAFAPQPTQGPLPAPAGGPVAIPAAAGRVMPPGSLGVTGSLAGISARRIIMATVAPILMKIAAATGRQMSLRQAVRAIRKAGKFLTPAAIAAAWGISIAELASLIMADAQLPRRRMNPANATALRRAARRIESFHRLCVRADRLRGPRRRSSSRQPAKCPPGIQVTRAG